MATANSKKIKADLREGRFVPPSLSANHARTWAGAFPYRGFPRMAPPDEHAMNKLLPRACHELHAFICDPGSLATYKSHIVPTAKARACAILAEFNKAQTDLVGRAVVLTDGKAGTVNEFWLDEFHGLRISIGGHEGKWPVSTIKLAQTD